MSASIDQQFVEFIVKSLVSKPDAVIVERRIDEKGVLLELTVDPEDLGRVIGKRGATAQSLRTLLRALGTKNDARYNLKIVDNGEPHERRERPSHDEETAAEAPKEETPAATPAKTPAPADDEDDIETAVSDEGKHSDVVSRTRKELEDLDDLDV
ncbi:MAG: RNA-binding protein [Candidatus Saccharibacteria bacterium]|nr:RNA-binding protein [Candidatus Saccharibacteria bacterium]